VGEAAATMSRRGSFDRRRILRSDADWHSCTDATDGLNLLPLIIGASATSIPGYKARPTARKVTSVVGGVYGAGLYNESVFATAPGPHSSTIGDL